MSRGHRHMPPPARCAHRRSPRYGFSLLEVVVVMGILGLVMALVLPAVGRSREAARQTQCLNHLRNIALAMQQFDLSQRRLPASGNYGIHPDNTSFPSHSWAVSLLPWLDQSLLYNRWNLDAPLEDPANAPLTRTPVPGLACPADLSAMGIADLSYAVNGGIGFTTRTAAGVDDCPLSPFSGHLDLNGDNQTCTGDAAADNLDRVLFKNLGLFFVENWKRPDITSRHHALADIVDGTSQTFFIAENVRAGFDPAETFSGFADPNPMRAAFYIGNPCAGPCSPGNVRYERCNQGDTRINSGRSKPEGTSPVPNSFHEGGAMVAYADGHVAFLSESIDGVAYAALASPQGSLLNATAMRQPVISADVF